ncbi:hypothetical protein COO31_007190, partial [Vibrio vulnificus]
NYLRKMGLNMAEIRQILASVYPCNEWKLLRTIYKKKITIATYGRFQKRTPLKKRGSSSI